MASPVSEIKRNHDVPEKIGKYVIINKIGKGSTGTVYLSHDPYYRRDVAIKVYNLEEDTDADRAQVSRKMFFNEAHMVGMLQHPNIMPIYDAGEEDGSYYVVTEHIQGARTLAAYCRPDNLLRVDDVVEIIYKCAKALHYAHGRGVIHRDIKPSNVMLTIDNDVRIIDFGIAIVSDSDVSRIEGIAGSPSYMSPEQVQSEELTPRSDLYSLGAVMYELLTGFRPFRADNLSKLLHQIVYATPPPIHTYRDDLPEELENVVVQTMFGVAQVRTAYDIAFNGQGYPGVSHHDWGDSLRYSKSDGMNWTSEEIMDDNAGNTGEPTQIAFEIDTTLPAAVTAVTMAEDTGASDTDTVTVTLEF